jgi:GNAT superfamily N-acetyltransferase
MTEISIRPAVATDIPRLIALDHSCDSDYALQIDFIKDEEQTDVTFRRMRLPRSVRIYYPRQTSLLKDNWNHASLMLIALAAGNPVAYLRLNDDTAPSAIWVTDLVVDRDLRRQGIASALLLSSQQWATQRGLNYAILEMTTKNNAMASLAQKLGFEFAGYNDKYFPTRDIAIFFGKNLK